MALVPRHLSMHIELALQSSRVVNLIGPRQVGKTTLVRDVLRDRKFITLDDDAVRGSLEHDAFGQLSAFLTQAEAHGSLCPVVIDEIQRLPALTLAIKRLVDADPRPGQFLLTGSSDIFTTAHALDSLAGRVTTLTLRPFSIAETLYRGPCRILDALAQTRSSTGHAAFTSYGLRSDPSPRTAVIDWIVRGGFPEIRGLSDRPRADRYRSYLDSIIERDVAPIARIRKPDSLRRLVDQLAARTATELNSQSLCQQIGIRKETLDSWMDALSRLGLIQRLAGWSSHQSRRDIKSPKLHFLDTGCATALRGEDHESFGLEGDPTAFGHLLETLVFIELEKSLPFQKKPWRLYHWRRDHREIDIIAESPGRSLVLFEVKASSTVSERDFRAMDWFREEGSGREYRCTSVVIHLGNEVLSFGPGKLALPVTVFGGLSMP